MTTYADSGSFDVSVVVPSWNTLSYLRRCLDSVRSQDDLRVEVLVVDNGSRDRTTAWLQSAGVNHYSLPRNMGFAYAVNLGVAQTTAPLVLVINADCVLGERCLAVLVNAIRSDTRLGGVQPLILQDVPAGEPELVYSRGQCLTRSGYAYEAGWGDPVADGEVTEEVFGVSGAVCLLRRDMLERLGGYDESYFSFYEDVDLNARGRLDGWHFACVVGARAIHTGHVAWRQHPAARSFNARLTMRNRIATAIKVLPPRGLMGMSATTLRWVVSSIHHRTTPAVLAGIAGATRQLPQLLRERRSLRGESKVALLTPWLTHRASASPTLSKVLPRERTLLGPLQSLLATLGQRRNRGG